MFFIRDLAVKTKLLVLFSFVLLASSVFARSLVDVVIVRADVVQLNQDGLLIWIQDESGGEITHFGPGFDVEDVFDCWIFPNSGYKKTNDPRSLKTLMSIALSIQIEQTCTTYHVNEEAKRKLYLSGQADIQRYFDRVERFKVEFRKSIDRGDNLRIEECRLGTELREAYRELPFRQLGSVYSKVLQKTLAAEQVSHKSLPLLNQKESVKAFDDLKLYEVCADLVEQYIAAQAPLRDKQQRIQLGEMLKRELRLTQIIDRDHPELAWRKMSELSEAAWKSRLDQAQFEVLDKKLQPLRSIAQNL